MCFVWFLCISQHMCLLLPHSALRWSLPDYFFGPNWGPKSPLLSLSPSNLFSFPPPTVPRSTFLPFSPLPSHSLLFFFAFSTYPVIPEAFPLLSWQIIAIPDRPWGIFGVFYMLTLKSCIWFHTLEPCDTLRLHSNNYGVLAAMW